MASRTPTLLLLLSCVFTVRILAANQIKGLDDAILFRINWAGSHSNLLDSPDYEKLVMTSSKNEQYECLVPINYGENNEESDAYTGPGPFELITPLFKKQTCNLRLDSYWTYELCHGLYIKQYREEREGKTTRLHEYVLGEFSSEDLSRMTKEEQGRVFKHGSVPTTSVEGVEMPYFMFNYTGGTVCDLTKQPRASHVLFVCYEQGRHDIYSIKETSTCEYEIVVLSPLICDHPAFRPRDQPQTSLHCIPMEGSPTRPRNLLQIEAESLKLRTSGAVLSGDTSRGSVKLKVVDDLDEILTTDSTKPQPKAPLFPPQPGIDHKLMEDFLNGDYCLHGGSGWWKFEFCYGDKVEQYHEERGGTRTTILLGKFSLAHHKAWLKNNPDKKYKPGKHHVTHFYSGGTTCDLTGKPRQVEVKLKCKESSSPSAVALFLLEPQTCEYILGIETPIVCSLLSHADELGLFTRSQAVADSKSTDASPASSDKAQDQPSPHQPLTQEGKGESEIIEIEVFEEEEEEEDKEDGGS
ncbi:hypothetical protein Pcinc_022406 [Petrolisthes cinctipes]|uniref:Endoplasmic reticulum lectin 1 n=1 Tax=Petrolisthes cinctipes TaxID=88211 RepID=A0AAE1FFI9_PETCI|nr:hypothetical protein Pcinc_022406 [Petrolisthes cinctipes]